LATELPGLAWRELTFPRKWTKAGGERQMELRLRELNEYFGQLVQLLQRARQPFWRTTTSLAFGRFVAEPASHPVGDKQRLSAEQLDRIRRVAADEAEEAEERKAAADEAAEDIVQDDIRTALCSGLSYDEFRQRFRPVGGDVKLRRLWAVAELAAMGMITQPDGPASDAGGGGWLPPDHDPSAPRLSVERFAMGTARPRRTLVSCHVGDVLDVDLSAQTFRPQLTFTLDWLDDGAIERADGGEWRLAVDAAALWRPQMEVTFSRTVWRLYGGSKGLMMWY
jgi:hypothetical protein